jgi:hypothetical protein
MTHDAAGAKVPESDAQQLIRQYLAIYDSYHNHKEAMAYLVTALFVGGAAALFVGNPFWQAYGVFEFVLLLSFLLVTATTGFLFVRRQLDLRRSAGDMFKACSRLATIWLSTPPEEGALQLVEREIDTKLFRGFAWPHALHAEMEKVKKERGSNWWASNLTYTALVSSALLVILRLFFAWHIGNEHMTSMLLRFAA